MASYPPPAPPPYGFDPKQQRRMAKEQFRMQRDAMKAQRDLYRMQQRGLRRRSLLGPLLLIAIGVVLLMVRNGRISPEHFLEEYSHWWPMLFVFAGAVVLAEWGFDQFMTSLHPEAPPMGRRGVGGGVILLLILLSIVGAGGMAIESHASDLFGTFGSDDQDWAQFLGEKHESDQTVDRVFPAGTTLSIDDAKGDVTVNGGSTDGQIHLSVHKEVYSRSDLDADHKMQDLAPQISSDGGTMAVRLAALEGGSTDVTVTVPDAATTTVTANHGDVRVTGLKAAVTVTANHGDVEFSTITGDATARMNRSDSSFSAHNITGAVALRGRAQDLNVEDVGGQLLLEGDFYGSTHIEKIGGTLRFHTSRTDLQLARLEGDIEVSNDASLNVDRAVGPTVLVTRDRNVTFDRLSGDISVTNTNGTVDVTTALPLGDVLVRNRHGSVNVTLPASAGFAVHADTTDGGIDDEFGTGSMTDSHHAVYNGTVGKGGPKVDIETSHGDIDLRKAMIGPLLPAAPIAPAAPPAPAAPKAAKTPKAPKAPEVPGVPFS